MIRNRYATAPEGEPAAVLSDLRRKTAVAVTRTARKERHRSGGEGSVYETAEGWRGAMTWTDDDGVRHRRVVRGVTSQGARDKLDELRRRAVWGWCGERPPGRAGPRPCWGCSRRDIARRQRQARRTPARAEARH